MSRPLVRCAPHAAVLAALLSLMLLPAGAAGLRSAPAAGAATHHHSKRHTHHPAKKARHHRKHVVSGHRPPAPPTPQPPSPPVGGPPPVGPGEPLPPPPGGGPPPTAGDPFGRAPLYVEPGSQAARTAREWSTAGRTAEAAEIEKIAKQPIAKWFGDWTYGHGGTQGDVTWWVNEATAAGDMPLLVAYDLPWRDCSQYSAGGAPSPAAYKIFIEEMAAGIGTRPAAVILEPDALSELTCLSSERQASYYSLLKFAVETLGRSTGTAVYLDAGHQGWQPAATMATRLAQAGVASARGFSLNVSNFDGTQSELEYGSAISAALGTGSHFVIDTSRNGRGPAPGGVWCNPPGRGLGTPPTASTGASLADAYLWIKTPGASDGTCNGGPAAGQWWPSQALELALNSMP